MAYAYFGGGGGGGSADNSAGGAGGYGGAGGPHPSSGGTSAAVRILMQALRTLQVQVAVVVEPKLIHMVVQEDLVLLLLNTLHNT